MQLNFWVHKKNCIFKLQLAFNECYASGKCIAFRWLKWVWN